MTIDSQPDSVRTTRKRALVTALAVATLVLAGSGGAVLVAGSASAGSTADLAMSQSISGSSTSGHTVDTVTIHNKGSASASNVNLVTLLKSTSSHWSGFGSAGVCEAFKAPSGYLGMVSCQVGTMKSGATVKEVLTWSGTAGTAFSVFATVSDFGPADPVASNNTSTISSYFGPRANLVLTNSAKTGTKAGTATVTSTVVNHGPNNASALQMVIEIKGAGYKSVHTSGTCQFIPAASGFAQAASCTLPSLKTGAKWTMTFSYTGTAGASLSVATTATAQSPSDPVTSNNSGTVSTKYRR
jgi:Domain of unknown function DUF11